MNIGIVLIMASYSTVNFYVVYYIHVTTTTDLYCIVWIIIVFVLL